MNNQESVVNSCQTNERAIIRTFMGYVDDSCMDTFTTDQVQRMQENIIEYLPSLCETFAPGGICVGRECQLGAWSQVRRELGSRASALGDPSRAMRGRKRS